MTMQKLGEILALQKNSRAAQLVHELPADILFSVQTDIKYAGYLAREQQLVEHSRHLAESLLPADLDYRLVPGLTLEVIEKLSHIRPLNLAQASRISGITPAALNCLEIHLHKKRRTRQTPSS